MRFIILSLICSLLFASVSDMSAALAMNLLGAMVGWMMEYNSMYFGFRFLYVLAMASYFAALIVTLACRPSPTKS